MTGTRSRTTGINSIAIAEQSAANEIEKFSTKFFDRSSNVKERLTRLESTAGPEVARASINSVESTFGSKKPSFDVTVKILDGAIDIAKGVIRGPNDTEGKRSMIKFLNMLPKGEDYIDETSKIVSGMGSTIRELSGHEIRKADAREIIDLATKTITRFMSKDHAEEAVIIASEILPKTARVITGQKQKVRFIRQQLSAFMLTNLRRD